jgi:hypothetical protein
MPFGKYSGHPIEDLPSDYLHWCLINLSKMGPELRGEMKRVLAAGNLTMSTADVDPVIRKFDERLKTWYRHASLKHHPDLGGSNEAQIIVNECFEFLAQIVAEMGGAK